MDIFGLLRTLGALGVVLGMLAGALWVVRRYDLKLPGRITTSRRKRVELVERLAVDGKRSIALIRRDGCEHLILMGPDGHAVIETGIQAPAFSQLVEPQPESAARKTPSIEPALSPRRYERRQFGHSGRWNRAAAREALHG